jgi:YggT family protein
MLNALASLVNLVAQVFMLIVVFDAVLSFVLPPFHPVREALDNFLEPFLRPIRQIVPPVGGLDFSPLVLIILVQVLATAIINVLVAL